MMLTVMAIDHLVFSVTDVDASAEWYERSLGMKRSDARDVSGETRTSVTFGSFKINLRPIDASQTDWFTGKHPGTGSQDLCLLTDKRPEDVTHHLRQMGIDIELGPITRTGARGPICSVYIRDPDGNLVEVTSYLS